MQMIYLDNAATSYPKAKGVADAIADYINHNGVNMNRSNYAKSTEAALNTLGLRESLCRLFGSRDTETCILTPGATFGLNLALKGYLHAGDHVLVSSMEHNAVMRPLNQIEGLSIEKVPCAIDGSLDPNNLLTRIRPETKLVCIAHASNVCGTLMPVTEIGEICQSRGLAFVVDAAQTAGHIPVHREAMHADALIVPAHKGLLGPQGIGAALFSLGFARQITPLTTGGTGSRSSLEVQPDDLPDKFESGTQNIPGIYGFAAALAYTVPLMDSLHQTAMRLCGMLLEEVSHLPNVRILGKQGIDGRMPVVALDFIGMDNAMVADRLASDYGIATRCGLHCAPSAHHTLGSYPQGAVRFSISGHNTESEIIQTLAALANIVTDRHTFAQA